MHLTQPPIEEAIVVGQLKHLGECELQQDSDVGGAVSVVHERLVEADDGEIVIAVAELGAVRLGPQLCRELDLFAEEQPGQRRVGGDRVGREQWIGEARDRVDRERLDGVVDPRAVEARLHRLDGNLRVIAHPGTKPVLERRLFERNGELTKRVERGVGLDRNDPQDRHDAKVVDLGVHLHGPFTAFELERAVGQPGPMSQVLHILSQGG